MVRKKKKKAKGEGTGFLGRQPGMSIFGVFWIPTGFELKGNEITGRTGGV